MTTIESLVPKDIRAGLLERIGGEWFVGDHQMYRGKVTVGMALTLDDAALIVLAVNTLRRFLEPPQNESFHDAEPVASALMGRIGVTLCICGEKLRLKDGAWEHFGVGKPFEPMEIRRAAVEREEQGR